MLNFNALRSCLLCRGHSRLQSLKIFVGNFDLVDFFLDSEGSVDQVKHILGEVVRIFDEETRMDQGSVIEVLYEFGTALVWFFLTRINITSTILFSS